MSSNPLGVNQGTQSFIASDLAGTVNYPVHKIDIGAAGATSLWDGAAYITSGTLNKGTVNAATVNAATVNAGTINAGTFTHDITVLPSNNWQTVVNSGTSTLGTLKAAVGGSSIYITDLIISVGGTPSNVALYSGGTANLIAGTFALGANGGLAPSFKIPLSAASGSAIVFNQSANGTLSITALGFVK